MGPSVGSARSSGDGSQPIQLCLGIGVGNPRETVDAENNFSKASCQAPFFFSFFFFFSSRGSILLSRIHGQRVVGERTSAQYVRESRNPPFSRSLSLSSPFFFLLFLIQIYPLNANIILLANFRLLPNLSHLFPRVSSLFLSPVFPRLFHFFKKVVEQSVIRFPRGDISFEGIKLC